MNVESTDREVLEAIQHEHEELRKKLGQISRAMAAHNTPGSQLAAMLRELHNELVEHFWNEENKGFFGEITAHAPQLTRQADVLCAEHRAMLHTATELGRFAEAGAESEAWWRELKSRSQAFSKQLMRHEGDENSLLQQAYQEDIGTND